MFRINFIKFTYNVKIIGENNRMLNGTPEKN